MTRNIDLEYARQLFLEVKHGAVKNSSLRSYKYPSRHFVEFLEEAAIGFLAHVDGLHLERWLISR